MKDSETQGPKKPKTIPADYTASDHKALDHAWRFFELHANQRFSIFNFYIVLMGFSAAGLGVSLQGSQQFSIVGAILGFLVVLLSFVFWKLDQRGALLIKHSETIIKEIEPSTVGRAGSIFTREAEDFTQSAALFSILKPWSVGRCLRLIFIGMAIFGAGGGALSALRFSGVIDWTRSRPTAPTESNKGQLSQAAGKNSGGMQNPKPELMMPPNQNAQPAPIVRSK